MDIIKCMYKGEVGMYLPVCDIEEVYNLPMGKLCEVKCSKKGDVVTAFNDSFENIGSIEELLEENAKLKESKRDLWRKFVYRGQENTRLRHNLTRLSSVLRPLMSVIPFKGIELSGNDIIENETGEVLSC